MFCLKYKRMLFIPQENFKNIRIYLPNRKNYIMMINVLFTL